MYYFKQIENKIEKYKVTYDKTKLEQVRNEVIDNCSQIIHRSIECEGYAVEEDLYHRDVLVEKIGVQKYFNGSSKDIYRCDYDEYIYPKLVYLLNELIYDDNVDAIDEIFVENESDKIEPFDTKVKNILNELEENDNLSIEEKRAKLSELEEALKIPRLYDENELIKPYYTKVKCLIRFKLVDYILTDNIERVFEFFENDLDEIKKTKTKVK